MVYLSLLPELSVGERIKKLRENKKMTQKELGEKINLSQKGVSNIENEVTALSLEHQIKLCEIFNVSHNYLIAGIDSSTILDELCRNISVSYKTTNVGTDSYTIPQMQISEKLFNYLLQNAELENNKHIPEIIKEQWKAINVEDFYKSKLEDGRYTELIPLPMELIYPDDNKTEWKQSDLIRNVNLIFNKQLSLEHEKKSL